MTNQEIINVTFKSLILAQEESTTLKDINDADGYVAQTNAEIVGWKSFD